MNKQINVFVASSDIKLMTKLSRYLQIKDFKVRNFRYCFNTDKFLSKIDEYKPDVLIFDSQLFTCDTVWLMNKIKDMQIQICQIILLPRKDQRIEALARNENISYVCMPYDFYELHEKIITENSIVRQSKISEKIRFFVKNLGVNEKLYGFEYTCSGIYIILFEHDKFVRLTKDIYPEIALRYGSSCNNVERCIRNCIKVFMENTENREYFYYLASKYGNFSIKKNHENFKITNSRFLNLLAIVFKKYYM